MTNLISTEKNLFGSALGWKKLLPIGILSRLHAVDERPLRAELFGAVQMEQHGRTLAASHKLRHDHARDLLLPRLAENERVLIEACALLTAAIKANRQIAPAAEWLLDNFYLIEEQIRIAKRHLPKNYSKELPRLLKGPSAGHPRVYDIALETIAHGDGRVDPENLSSFVAAYQEVTPLKLGELWAIPIMLRLALIDNLRRVAVQLAAGRTNSNLAESWADQMVETAEKEPANLILLVADMARSAPPMTGSFVAELVRRLQGQSPALSLPLTWIGQRLAEAGHSIEELVQAETQQQAADQVSISNSIGSLRSLGAMDWRDFVETMSVVEQTLRRDRTGIYGKMNFATRDRYRHVIEKIAKTSSLSEVEVADRAMGLAGQQDIDAGPEARSAHVGYYLVDKGLTRLEHAVGVRLSLLEAIKSKCSRAPLRFYLGSIILLIGILSAGLTAKAYQSGLRDEMLALIGVLSLLVTSHLAVALVNWLATLMAIPHPLPRMDFSKGIPPGARSLVVVPTLLFNADNVDSLCEALEVRFLANRDDNLRFCLLTDFADADTETTPADEALVSRARDTILHMNKNYGDGNGNGGPFLLLHRPRRWNAQERRWMGYERKRGKLADLNSFLRGGAREAFSCIAGNTEALASIKYVITLDTDTQLPRDSARQFVATIAHPLNYARYDETGQRVVEGYGILQPRVTCSLPGAAASRYEKLCGSEAGIDPYTRTVSDVYQDLFGEGSFIGKGIYDVDAFERALQGRFPENRILSHDLLEGCYARAGLLSDVQLHEAHPARYGVDVRRRHRWIRGDWQLLAWLLPRVPVAGGARQRNPLPTLSRWKLMDNLRRSVMPSTFMLLLLLDWFVLPATGFWTRVVLAIILLPPLIASMLDLLRKADEVLLRQHVSASLRSAGHHFSHAFLAIAFLPYEAFFSLDAILRTLWRLLISHRRLLEWNPSSESERQGGTSLRHTIRMMWIAPATVVGVVIALLVLRRASSVPFDVTVPLLLLWLASPVIAWWISRPVPSRDAQLSDKQTAFLEQLARKNWAFFETFVGPEDNWLPPDNVQEHPVYVVARRTSPTNIGLALLANLSAYDFAYITVTKLLERTDNTLRTMAALERHQGHFYNWYDTQHLKPLHPMYVSSVDSGNLAGHMLVLRLGLLGLPDHPIVATRLTDGINDTFRVLLDIAPDSTQPELARLQEDLDTARAAGRPATLTEVAARLDQLKRSATQFAAGIEAGPNHPVSWWAQALVRQCRDAQAELLLFAPWLTLPALEGVEAEFSMIDHVPTLRDLAGLSNRWQQAISPRLASDAITPAARERLSQLTELIAQGSREAAGQMQNIERLALQASEFARMEYGFLYDQSTNLLAIGYNVSDRRRDLSYYDLLASEARLCSFVAIAQGQLPQENWFALGRQLTIASGAPILLSWSGSMFEYLMPMLIMPSFPNTLLDQTSKAAVQRQIEYGAQRGVPWGISECGYNTFDAGLNYQYRAFGVPGLGLKRGLGDDLVVAPYASMLALMVAPERACENLQRLATDGFGGKYGFYEAIDYTPSRLPRGQSNAVVKSFMAHHKGMGFLSLAYLLLDRPMQKRFESDPLFQATILLLHERIPKATGTYLNTSELADIRSAAAEHEMPMRVIARADTRMPEVQLLSNGRYHVMITNAGGSSSRWKDLAVTRWREDGTCDNWGAFCYVRDREDGTFWSTAYQPTLAQPRANSYEVIFSEGRAEFRRHDHGFDMHTEIVVSPEDDIELRRTRITNCSRVRRTIDVTSYAEIVLAPAAADAMHPAFSNLFVQTEIVPERHAILCTRRPRSEYEAMPWMFHLMALHGGTAGKVSYETDRLQFIGRGQSLVAPHAMTGTDMLSGSSGSVLDPIAAIRYQITLEPEQSAVIDIVSGVAEERAAALHLIDKYQDRHLADRVFELAWTHTQVILRQLNATESDGQLYGRLANSVIYSNSLLRADASVLIKNRRGQSGLWGYAISGDLPIVLLQIGNPEHINLVRQLVQAHAYWRMKGIAVDLVIWNEDRAGYRQVLQDMIMGLIASGMDAHTIDRPGGIFVRMADQIPNEDRILLQSVARAIITDGRGTLAEQINRRSPTALRVPLLIPTRTAGALPPPRTKETAAPRDLILFNGLGGFTPDGREYVVTPDAGQVTPAPWVNVMANPHFGSVISESGQAYTWGENAHEFRLTPWANDSVTDASGEAMYLRDEESGQFWSPTPLPACGQGTYVSRHGFGYSVFEHVETGISSTLWVYVALDASVKFSVLKVRNDSGASRRLSATGYVEWVLGDLRPKSAMHVVTEADSVTGALFARNSFNTEFPDRIAFFFVDALEQSKTGDRSEFIGRNGSLRRPAAMSRTRLSGKLGAGLDPCAAIQVPFQLADGEEREIVFMLGVAGRRNSDVSGVVQRFRGSHAALAALQAVQNHWHNTLGAVQVETPDVSLNVLANGWLMYQTIACRLWARSGYYQSGGAFGFRDQLQDVMALVHAEPHLVRAHLLLCAEHQFVEGDVQHWWHPPSGRGVRTHCSDDFLWLPLATCRYLTSTHDTGVLDEIAPFLEGRPVNTDEDSYYDMPARSGESASLYEHCVRAILRGLRFGTHGLPLIGSCDWNDGMDKVGDQGKGESVWLAFLLYEVLMRFAEVARMRGDQPFAERCETEAAQLQTNIEQQGWDGGWYRRAYFDDGTPLGSAANAECQIDSISQSWSVLSGAGDPQRSREAMNALDARLVRRDYGLVQLLTPPFDKSGPNPGYIRGYVPGVRENGGQYTHAAIWTAMAFAKVGDHERAWEVLRMINPIAHGSTAKEIEVYKVEPYVVAADVYGVAPHIGRGGWTWYTGSSGWMYRLIVESLLGLTLLGDKLRITPCLPADWDGFSMRYRYRATTYAIVVRQGAAAAGRAGVSVDGIAQAEESIPLVDDGRPHTVEIWLRGVPEVR